MSKPGPLIRPFGAPSPGRGGSGARLVGDAMGNRDKTGR